MNTRRCNQRIGFPRRPSLTARRALLAWLSLLPLLGTTLSTLSLAAQAADRATPIVVTDTTLERPGGEPALPVRIAAPVTGTGLPVVLFSHGAYSSKDDYSALLDHWAAHGYIVVAVTHRDSTRLGAKRGNNDPRFMQWRLEDMALVADRLPSLLGSLSGSGLAQRADTSRIAATGHSFGGLIAQTLGGAMLRDPASGKAASPRLPNVRATIIFSGAGAMPPVLTREDFLTLTVPTLVTVGTDDLKQAPDLSGYEWRRQPYDLIAPGNKYLLVLDGADHYLGGSVGRDDLPRSPQADAYIAAFRQASTLFLDAWLKDDPAARRRLDAVPPSAAAFAERATLERR